MEPIDPGQLRISDADRNRVAEILREAAGDGRIDLDELDELDERLEATYAAKTYSDLVPITFDLPGQAAPAVPRPSATPARRTPAGTPASYETSLAVMSECKRSGPWDVGHSHTATAFMGSVVLALREARFPQGEVTITANAVMGSVEVIVDAHTRVKVAGAGIMGSFQECRPRVEPELDDHSPVVRISGVALMGSVEVKRKGPPGELGRTIRRHLGH